MLGTFKAQTKPSFGNFSSWTDETMGKQGESQQEVMAFVKVTQFLNANVERKHKLYQAHLIRIFSSEPLDIPLKT